MDKKKVLVIVIIAAVLTFFVGVVVGSVYGGVTETIFQGTSGDGATKSSEDVSTTSSEGADKTYSNIDEIYQMKTIIDVFSQNGALALNEWEKELYGKDQTIIKDANKKVLYYAAFTYLHNQKAVPYVKYENGNGSNDETTYNVNDFKDAVVNRFKTYFDNKVFTNAEVAFLTEASNKDAMCPQIFFDEKQNTYKISGNCGGFIVAPELYKFDFSDGNYIAYGQINITNFESYGGLLSKNINGKYKYTFKMDPPYNLYLYSIERIK